MMDLEHTVGLRPDGSVWLPDRHTATGSILLKLAAMGIEIPPETAGEAEVFHLAGNLFARYREQARLLSEHLCPADRRIQRYIDQLYESAGVSDPVRLPAETLILDHYGLARELSLPLDGDKYENELVSSYRLDNGVLHNPANDRRTTQGVFHVAEGGLPIPADKIARAAQWSSPRLLRGGAAPAARAAAAALHRRPEASRSRPSCRCCCGRSSVPRCRVTPEKRMEVRFFAPGGLVSNLDFVESIFGNAGDPVPARERRRPRRGALDRPHRLRHPRAAPHPAEEEGPRPAAREPGDERSARRHVLGDEDELYNDGRPSRSPSRGTQRRDRHASSPTTTSATARRR